MRALISPRSLTASFNFSTSSPSGISSKESASLSSSPSFPSSTSRSGISPRSSIRFGLYIILPPRSGLLLFVGTTPLLPAPAARCPSQKDAKRRGEQKRDREGHDAPDEEAVPRPQEQERPGAGDCHYERNHAEQ